MSSAYNFLLAKTKYEVQGKQKRNSFKKKKKNI